jgi:hypothetical protein
MRLDHLAYRVQDRLKAASIVKVMLGYSVATEFDIKFDDGSTAECIVMTPPEKNNRISEYVDISWVLKSAGIDKPLEHHLAPEIFISDGSEGSIVGEWVASRGGVGGIHHAAYQVNNIDDVVEEWKSTGIEFLSDSIIDCPEDDLRQIFTKPIEIMGGMIFELIERGAKGFCQNSVKDLMNSTKEV